MSIKPNPDPLRSDPVATVLDSCVGCGMCGEVSHAAVLCPSFYRAEVISNPNALGPLACSAAAARSSARCSAASSGALAATAIMTDEPGAQPIKIAILAMGGEGGGVLADWIVDLGEANGHIAQSTSVAGVAQRTGATIYYIELFPRAAAEAQGATPVLALIPTPGDVDVLIASELMEAGRAVQRGLVTPDRTTLIASTHRVYAIAEKSAHGRRRGRQRGAGSRVHRRRAALHPLRHGRGQRAQRQRHQRGAVRRAVRVGHAALRPRGLRSHDPQRRCRRRGQPARLRRRRAAGRWTPPQPSAAPTPRRRSPRTGHSMPTRPSTRCCSACASEFPEARPALLTEGVRRLLDYQDPAYAALYLDRVARHRRGRPRRTDGRRPRATWRCG